MTLDKNYIKDTLKKLGQKYELEGVRDATLEDEERAKKILGIE